MDSSWNSYVGITRSVVFMSIFIIYYAQITFLVAKQLAVNNTIDPTMEAGVLPVKTTTTPAQSTTASVPVNPKLTVDTFCSDDWFCAGSDRFALRCLAGMFEIITDSKYW